MNKVPEALDALAVDGRNGASKVPCTFELLLDSSTSWSEPVQVKSDIDSKLDQRIGHFSPEMGGILLGYGDFTVDPAREKYVTVSGNFYLMKLPVEGQELFGRVIQMTEPRLTVRLISGVVMDVSRSLGDWPGLYVGQKVLCRVESAGFEFGQQQMRVEGRLVELLETITVRPPSASAKAGTKKTGKRPRESGDHSSLQEKVQRRESPSHSSSSSAQVEVLKNEPLTSVTATSSEPQDIMDTSEPGSTSQGKQSGAEKAPNSPSKTPRGTKTQLPPGFTLERTVNKRIKNVWIDLKEGRKNFKTIKLANEWSSQHPDYLHHVKEAEGEHEQAGTKMQQIQGKENIEIVVSRESSSDSSEEEEEGVNSKSQPIKDINSSSDSSNRKSTSDSKSDSDSSDDDENEDKKDKKAAAHDSSDSSDSSEYEEEQKIESKGKKVNLEGKKEIKKKEIKPSKSSSSDSSDDEAAGEKMNDDSFESLNTPKKSNIEEKSPTVLSPKNPRPTEQVKKSLEKKALNQTHNIPASNNSHTGTQNPQEKIQGFEKKMKNKNKAVTKIPETAPSPNLSSTVLPGSSKQCTREEPNGISPIRGPKILNKTPATSTSLNLFDKVFKKKGLGSEGKESENQKQTHSKLESKREKKIKVDGFMN